VSYSGDRGGSAASKVSGTRHETTTVQRRGMGLPERAADGIRRHDENVAGWSARRPTWRDERSNHSRLTLADRLLQQSYKAAKCSRS
jgi:hypothetical protein